MGSTGIGILCGINTRIFHFQKRSTTDVQNEDDGEEDKATYDASKFIEYPGFNAPVPSNLIDVSHINPNSFFFVVALQVELMSIVCVFFSHK